MSFTRDTYCKVTELFDLPMCMNIMQVFGYDCLFTDSFQEKNRKEHEDDNYIKFSRGSSELQRALLVYSTISIFFASKKMKSKWKYRHSDHTDEFYH